MISAERYKGGGTFLAASGILGVVGLILTYVLYAMQSTAQGQRVVMSAYLTAFTFWVGIAVAAIIWVAVFHASHARWSVVLRRGLESLGAATPIFILLFIPVLVGAKVIFMWLTHPANLPAEQLALLHHKEPYLNMPFFIIRAVIYFVIWLGAGELLLRWSNRQDTEGGVKLTAWMRRLGAGSIPFLAIAITWASFDWLMSVDPFWNSAVFGGYYFAGSFLGAISLLAIMAAALRGPNLFGSMMTKEHFHNVGKLMLAFTIFWAYLGFSQFMLQWIANIPEEASWWVVRMRGAWAPVSWVILIGQFCLPFCVLLSRDVKYYPKALAGIAVWILAMHYIDIYWLIMPSVSPGAVSVSWAHLTSFVGVGGIAAAFTVFRLRGRFTVPVQDPYLADSLRYVNP